MRAFVENYNSAQGALHDSRFADAVAFADAAGPHATDAAQWAAIENLRIAAFTRSGNFSAALQALDALAALDCQEAAKIQDMRDSILKQMPLELEPN